MISNKLIRVIHWSFVFCLLLVYATAYIRRIYTTQAESENWYLLLLHMNFAVLSLVLVLASIFFQFRKVKAPSKAELIKTNYLAKTMHFFLYAMLLVLPISAYIGTGISIPLLGYFYLPGFNQLELFQNFIENHIGQLVITFMEPFQKFHIDFGSNILLPVLIFGHASAAIIRCYLCNR